MDETMFGEENERRLMWECYSMVSAFDVDYWKWEVTRYAV